jgi:hypothetical protein
MKSNESDTELNLGACPQSEVTKDKDSELKNAGLLDGQLPACGPHEGLTMTDSQAPSRIAIGSSRGGADRH